MPDLPLSSPPGDSGADGPLRLWFERIERWRTTVSELSWSRLAIGAVAAVVVLGGIVLLTRKPAPPPLVLPRAPVETPSPSSTGPAAAGAPATITVHAAGALVRPGVYAVPEGARVADVVEAAGGTLGEADLDQLNLAAKVADAERVYVPRKGEVPPMAGAATGGSVAGGTSTAGTSPPAPVDLNTANAEQLDALPGVGPATAQAILGFRASHGRFRSVDDLLEVRGIGPAKLEALRPLVKV